MEPKEKTAEFYDILFRRSFVYRLPYKESPYYPLWQEVVKLLPSDRNIKLLEIGCGSGQFAQMVIDHGYTNYVGIDHSRVAIELARQKTLGVAVADAYTCLSRSTDYNIIILLEVLEHIDDLRLLGLVRRGATVIFTVPNFSNSAHLRYFSSAEEVRAHYEKLIDISILKLGMGNRKGQKWFLVKGHKL